MIGKIQSAIAALSGVSDWKIRETDRESHERFYVGKALDMARASGAREYSVSLCSDGEGPAGKERGEASCILRSGMSSAEIGRALELCAYSASRSRGPWYPLPEKNGGTATYPVPALYAGKMEDWAERFAGAFFAEDSRDGARLNSLELFIRRSRVRIFNSRDLDESYQTADAAYEYIVQARGAKEEVELFRENAFASFDEAAVRSELALFLRMAKDRAEARGIGELGVKLKGLPVILSGSEAIGQFFGYYLERTDARAVYDKASDASVGYRFGPEGAACDAVSLTMAAGDERLPEAAPVDSDGLRLSDLPVIEGGRVTGLHGEAKYCALLGLPALGAHRAARISGGSLSAAELRSGPHIECVSFSDFSVEAATGNFGGEIRLGYYSDGKGRLPFSGGAVSGKVAENVAALRFSRESAPAGKMVAPECALLASATVSGS